MSTLDYQRLSEGREGYPINQGKHEGMENKFALPVFTFVAIPTGSTTSNTGNLRIFRANIVVGFFFQLIVQRIQMREGKRILSHKEIRNVLPLYCFSSAT